MKRPLSRILAPQNGRRQAVADLGPWSHNLHLPDGTQTAPEHSLGDFPASRWRELAPSNRSCVTTWNSGELRAAVAALERNGGTHQRPAEETERRRNGGPRQDGADGNGKSNSPRQAP